MVIEVTLPTLHADQVKAFRLPARFKAIRCGRRWGKTTMAEVIGCDGAIKRQSIGIFAPEYKFLTETYNEIADILAPVKKSSSKVDGVIRTITGGRLDFWTLDNERAGRSRKYHGVILDEAAFTKPNMLDIWNKSIKPTLLDYKGWAIAFSNTNGDDSENFFWRICNEPEHGFTEYHAPSSANPYLPADEIERLKEKTHPLVFAQEYAAEFVSWAGVSFFSLDKLLENGEPVAEPVNCDAVFAVVDTATKTGSANDGTAVTYCAFMRASRSYHLVILDWDIVQIEGALLETWLPTVAQNLEMWAQKCRARAGSLGVFIEDKASGEILLQQARRRGLNTTAIDSRLTSMGKDERAISVSGYVYREMVKIGRAAFDKVVQFKGVTRNHLIAQVTGFRVGDKDAARRADDLLDTFCYCLAIALGNAEGF